MRRAFRDNSGQAAMVDAILFMTVILIACAVIIGSTGLTRQDSSGVQQYTRDFAQTLLAVELVGLEYMNADGDIVNLGGSGRSIGRLLCDQALILGSRAGDYNFSAYDSEILASGKSLIRPGLDFALSCNGGTVFISDAVCCVSELPHTRSAAQITVLSDAASPVTVTVYVWVV